MAHGGGGTLMHRLLEGVFLPALGGPASRERHDGAVLDLGGVRVAMTTDSFVVHPLFFPGGDIGTLAVNGTVNDLAMCGARPLYLSAGFLLEEGLPLETLRRVVTSMQSAAREAGVQIVTGDTKVVDRGKGDGIFVNTAGIGIVAPGVIVAPSQVQPGDAVLLSGDVGRHGMAIMAVREGLEFDSTLESDCAPLVSVVMALLDGAIRVHCLRDLTRGGLASGLVEIGQTAGRDIQIMEAAVPVRDDVQGACEVLGLDPLYVANEGRFVAFVAAADAERALAIMRAHPVSAGAVCIGEVTAGTEGLVTMTSRIGASRIVDMLTGEQLPRIC
jgi:hydrogenase expression/formation protein HypE